MTPIKMTDRYAAGDGRVRSFEPVVRPDSRVLILGSMPGVQSLERNQYYANPRNQFWTLVYGAFGRTPHPDYDERIRFVLEHGIALWDVLAECVRPGSLDSSIREERTQNFAAFYRRYPGIRAVFCNGSKAYDSYRRQVGPDDRRVCIKLPSSSPTPGKYNKSLADKQLEWNAIRQWAERGSPSHKGGLL
ncbi:DNA-deoxyinosine glycosylase [Paenibacillus thermoaerophilus]|uniref:DNA-deoxyinosine glycosylase n=1 Tax=Paenibacillus thermoaerophilus TaxID=1215385 RepID=A0ABW2V639_9BACL|nr:DNA-deoxyinosine glycosylase [Paenibacillus thermoaerophilus]